MSKHKLFIEHFFSSLVLTINATDLLSSTLSTRSKKSVKVHIDFKEINEEAYMVNWVEGSPTIIYKRSTTFLSMDRYQVIARTFIINTY